MNNCALIIKTKELKSLGESNFNLILNLFYKKSGFSLKYNLKEIYKYLLDIFYDDKYDNMFLAFGYTMENYRPLDIILFYNKLLITSSLKEDKNSLQDEDLKSCVEEIIKNHDETFKMNLDVETVCKKDIRQHLDNIKLEFMKENEVVEWTQSSFGCVDRSLYNKKTSPIDEERLNLVKCILNCNEKESKVCYEKLYSKGIRFKLTRDFNDVKAYIKEYEESTGDRLYSLVSSSTSSLKVIEDKLHIKDGLIHEINNQTSMDDFNNLQKIITEKFISKFNLNASILILTGDFLIKNNEWYVNGALIKDAKTNINSPYKFILEYDNIKYCFINMYKDLFLSGSQELIIMIPSYKSLDESFNFLKLIGFEVI